MKLTAVEIFPCSGGMSEGFRRAGITFDWAFDYSKEACDSYEANMGHRPVQMDARDLLRMARSGWRPAADIDLVVADPPCTPWSRAGKRLGVEDERDMLGVTCELILLLRPRAYLIGNVPGLDDLTQWHHLQGALRPLGIAGYCIGEYASLDAADFGVPQHRVRPFWFGHLGGPHLRWPLPTHGAPSSSSYLPGTEVKPWATCRDALGHLPIEQLGRPVRLKWKAKSDHRPSEPSEPSEPSKTLTRNTHSDGALLVNPRHPPASPASPASPAPTLGAKSRRQSAEVLAIRDHHRLADASRPSRVMTGNRQDDARFLEWPWDRPSTTIFGDPRIPEPGHHGGSMMSQPDAVVLSELAAKLLQGFPESWQFIAATKTARWSMLGQAMPPALAHAVACSVAEQLASTVRA